MINKEIEGVDSILHSLEKHESRKLQITGGSTYIISLPKGWVTKMNMKKGSRVELVAKQDGSIVIFPEGALKIEKSSEATIEAEPSEKPDSIIRKIVSTYLVGYNIISIRTKNRRFDPIQRSKIKDFVRRMLVGTEIIFDSSKEIVLKVLLSYPELSVQSALRRMCIISSSMHKDAVEALKEGDMELAQEVIDMDAEVDRFGLYIIRQLKAAINDQRIIKEIGLNNARDCLGYRLITKTVERTADHAVEVAEKVMILVRPLASELIEKIEKMSLSAILVFEEAVETLFKRDFSAANNVVQKAKELTLLKKETMELALKLQNLEENLSIRLIIESITRAIEYASDIAEIVMNLNIEDVLIATNIQVPNATI